MLFAWSPLIVALLIAAAGAAIGLDTGLERLLDRWTKVWDYSHGYLVVLMSLWLFYVRLEADPPAHVRPSPVGLLVLAGVVLAYGLASVLDFTIAMQLLLPIGITAAVYACGGWHLARLAAIPAAFLYFAIPIWDLTIVPLQNLATVVVKAMLAMTGIPAHVEGHVINIPVGAFEIAQACSGMTFVVAGLSLAAFYSLSWYHRVRDGVLLLLLAAAVAIFANWVRIYSLVAIGYYTRMEHYLIVEDHELYGWALYGVMMIGVIWFARWLELRAGPAKNVAVPVTPQFGSAAPTLIAGVLVALILSAPALLKTTGEAPESPEHLSFGTNGVGEWQGIEPQPDWEPNAHSPQQLAYQGFRKPGAAQVDAYVARYAVQLAASKVNTTRHRFDKDWQRQDRRLTTIETTQGPVVVDELELALRGERRLVWTWYRIGGRQTASPTMAKLLELPALAAGRRDGALLAVSASCDLECDGARSDMEAFLKSAINTLHLVADEGRSPGL